MNKSIVIALATVAFLGLSAQSALSISRPPGNSGRKPHSPEASREANNPPGRPPTNEPPPQPPAPRPVCDFYSLDINYLGQGGLANPIFRDSGLSANCLTMIRNEIQAVIARCNQYIGSDLTDYDDVRHLDDCVAGYFLPGSGIAIGSIEGPWLPSESTQYLCNCEVSPNSWIPCDCNTAGALRIMTVGGRHYYDKDCNHLSQKPASGLQCPAGTIDYFSSPVSLIVDDGYDVDSSTTLTNFKLNPHHEKEQWLVWKGSEKAPLLVFDPEQSGQVVSGAQLFGNWTFGGRTEAKAPVSLGTTANAAQPWKDGLEALGSLDIDRDSKLSGQELTPLALWFDRDQDAQVDSGEMVRVSDYGIREIRYAITRHESDTNNLYVDGGYTRVTPDGKTRTGTLVDWHTEVSERPETLLLKIDSQEQRPHPKSLPAQPPTSSPSSDTSIVKAGLDGPWAWKFQKMDRHAMPEGFQTSGHFILKVGPDGMVKGHTYAALPLVVDEAEYTVFSVKPIVGRVAQSGRGDEPAVNFNVPSATSVDGLKSSAVLRSDREGPLLVGETTGYAVSGRKRVPVKYSWIARRAL